MGIARRIAELYEAKVNALLNRAEDPREMLDFSYTRQQELLADIRRGIVEVTASRRRAAQQAGELERSAERLRQQAEQAAAAGSDDLARQALSRRAALLSRAGDLHQQEAGLAAEAGRLTAAAERLQAKNEAFRFRKEVLKAGYTTARVSADTGQVFAGVSEEMTDAGQLARRAEDKTAQAQARADALDDLLASGAPGTALPATGGPAGPGPAGGTTGPGPAGGTVPPAPHLSPAELQEQLDEVTTRAAVDEELTRIKQRLASARDGAGTGDHPRR